MLAVPNWASAMLAVPNWGEQITAIKFDEVKSAMRQQAALAVAQQCSEVGTALRATRRLWTYGAVGGLAGISRFRGRAGEEQDRRAQEAVQHARERAF